MTYQLVTIYCISGRSGGLELYKIGFTLADAKKRCSQLLGGFPVSLTVVHELKIWLPCGKEYKIERRFHSLFDSMRVAPRREWFYLTLPCVEWFKTLTSENYESELLKAEKELKRYCPHEKEQAKSA